MPQFIQKLRSYFKKITITPEKEQKASKQPVILDDIFTCQLADNKTAAHYAKDLFLKSFHTEIPSTPYHFLSFYHHDDFKICVGYVHFSSYQNDFLCGGLVMDSLAYRKIPKVHRDIIQVQGGIAENMLKKSFKQLPEHEVIWGYVGDTKARNVDTRVGFQETEHQYIMAIWPEGLSDADKTDRLTDIIKTGPF